MLKKRIEKRGKADRGAAPPLSSNWLGVLGGDHGARSLSCRGACMDVRVNTRQLFAVGFDAAFADVETLELVCFGDAHAPRHEELHGKPNDRTHDERKGHPGQRAHDLNAKLQN